MSELHEKICLEILKQKVKDITSDPKKSAKDFLFFAPSEKEHVHIKEVIERGAKIVLTTHEYKEEPITQEVCFFCHPRMSTIYHKICSFMWNKQPANICAVTGSYGKASIAYFFSQICSLNGKTAATPGNMYVDKADLPGREKEIDPKTSDAAEVYKILNRLTENNVEYCCLEASAAQLQSRRIDGVNLKAAAFTNFSPEDLQDPEEVKQHFQMKLRLFSEILPNDGIMILPSMNEYTKKIRENCSNKKVLIYGRIASDIQLVSQLPTQNGQVLTIKILGKELILRTKILGKFQGNNLMIAIGLALSCGIDPFSISYDKIKAPTGKMEFLDNSAQEYRIMTDPVQTPAELQSLLLSLRWHFPYNDITLILSGKEDSDRKKRLMMSQIAAKMANKIIITDSPNKNDSARIIRRELMTYCTKAIEIEGREKAIKYAIDNCKPSEIIIIPEKESKESIGLRIDAQLKNALTTI